MKVWALTGPLGGFSLFEVTLNYTYFNVYMAIILQHYLTSIDLQLADSHRDIILQDTSINLGIPFPVDDVEPPQAQRQQSPKS